MPLQITDINLQFLPNLYHPSLFDSSWSTLNHATEIASVNRTYETKNFILCKNNLSLILLMFCLANIQTSPRPVQTAWTMDGLRLVVTASRDCLEIWILSLWTKQL